MSAITTTDLGRLEGWESVGNFAAVHRATGVVVEREPGGARPWRVRRGTVRIGSPFKHEASAVSRARSAAYDITSRTKET